MDKVDRSVDGRGMIRAVASDKDLDGVDLRVFLYLFGRLEFLEYTRIEQGALAEALGRRKEHISRSIRKLKAKRIIIEAEPRIGRSPNLVLNPNYGR